MSSLFLLKLVSS